jgi:hypothetical protein
MPWTHRLLHLLIATAIIMNIIYHMKNAAHSSPGFTSEVTAWGLFKVSLLLEAKHFTVLAPHAY